MKFYDRTKELALFADIFEVKKDKSRYDEQLLTKKVDNMLMACPEFKKYELRLKCLSLEDM